MIGTGREHGAAAAWFARAVATTARVAGSLMAVLALAMALPAWAAPHESPTATQQAKAHFRAGTRLYKQARYREAISEFEAAYRIKPHGVIFYNLAQCHERLGDIPAALRAYHEYLRAMPGAEDRGTVQAAMANLERRLAATGMQQMLVYTDPPGALVKVDGRPRGSTPFAAVLSLGVHALSLSKPGFGTLEREVVLARDRSLLIDVALQPAAPASASLRPIPPREAPAGPAASLTAAGPKKAPAHRPRIFTWVAAGVAAGALAAGIAYGLAARNASDDLRRTERSGAEAQRLADSASSKARTANILYGVAGAAGAVGMTLFFVEGHF
jgi:hypothetical protein